MTYESTPASTSDINALAVELQNGFAQLNRRLDRIDAFLDVTLGHVCDNQQRIEMLEERLGMIAKW